MAKMTMPAFEKSKLDKDKGMKEGSPAEVKKDKAAIAKSKQPKSMKGAAPFKAKR